MINKKLKDKIVLITAGAQGIGAAITKHFIDSGANVIIHYFSSEKAANELKNYAIENGQKAIALKADLTIESQVKLLIDKAIKAFERIDILINNAGSLIARNSLDDIEEVFGKK